jgi:hypothetical protein
MESDNSKAKGIAAKLPIGTPTVMEMVTEIFGVSRAAMISAIAFVCLVLCVAVYFVVLSAPPHTITITTGPEDSIYQKNAVKYANILARHGVELKILSSQGSEENLQRLSDPSFRVDVGFVQGGVTNRFTNKLVSLGSISHQPLLVFYRGLEVERLSQLNGKRLAIGPVGSGTRELALTLLEANGIKEGGPTMLMDLEPQRASRALLEGTIDAAFLMGEAASPAVMRELLRAPDIRLLSFAQAPAYARRFGYLSVLELQQGCIDLGSNIPPHDVSLIGPTVELIARENLHPALSDLLLEAAREVHGNGTILQSKGEFPAPIEHDFHISADAARFYRSGKSLLYRYLPFWLASLTSRILVVFVPLVVVLVPILRSIPFLYRWRIRSRILRWYRALLALERDLSTESEFEKQKQLLNRLDEIEKAVNRMKVPTFYADQFYSLRGDIDFVRQLSGRYVVALETDSNG